MDRFLRALSFLSITILIWSIIFSMNIGEDFTWQVVALAWCMIASAQGYELEQRRRDGEE